MDRGERRLSACDRPSAVHPGAIRRYVLHRSRRCVPALPCSSSETLRAHMEHQTLLQAIRKDTLTRPTSKRTSTTSLRSSKQAPTLSSPSFSTTSTSSWTGTSGVGSEVGPHAASCGHFGPDSSYCRDHHSDHARYHAHPELPFLPAHDQPVRDAHSTSHPLGPRTDPGALRHVRCSVPESRAHRATPDSTTTRRSRPMASTLPSA